MRQANDLEPVRKAIGGDGEAFAELVSQYRDAVYGVCYHRVGHAEEAKDLAQEAFVAAYVSLRQLRDPAAFPAWLRRVAERVCATWRRRQRLSVVEADDVAEEPAPPRDLELPITVRAALAQLTDDTRLAVTLYYINGYSTGEVARFLDIPTGTVKSRLHHARRRLKETLMDEYREALREGAPGADFEGAVVRAVKSLEEARSLPMAQRWGGPQSQQDMGWYFVLDRAGAVQGECYFSPGALTIRGVPVEVAHDSYMSGEGGDWVDEGTGVMDLLVPAALAHAAESGIVLASWHGELVPATRHGFVPCFHHHRITVPARNLTLTAVEGTIRAPREGDAAAVARLRAMERHRPTMWAWQRPGAQPSYVLERAGEIVGCYSLGLKHRQARDSAAQVNEMEGLDMAAYRTMVAHWADTALAEGVETVATYLSPDHPIGGYMLARGGVAQTQGASWNVYKDEELLCILDLVGVLQAIAPGLGRAVKGRVGIDMDGETATITAGDPPRVTKGLATGVAPSRIGRVAMTHLLVGYRSVFEICGRADVAIRDEDYALLDALFPATRPYAWPDPYVWDEDSLRESRPWAFEEPWVTRAAEHLRPWA